MTASVSRPCPASAIDDELALLWRDAGRDGPVARAMMANLVVFTDCAARERVDLTAPIEHVPVTEVVRRHPSRVILLYHDRQKDLRSPNDATLLASRPTTTTSLRGVCLPRTPKRVSTELSSRLWSAPAASPPIATATAASADAISSAVRSEGLRGCPKADGLRVLSSASERAVWS